MLASTVVYLGLMFAVAGLVLVVTPVGWMRVLARRRAAAVAKLGVMVIAMVLAVPAPEFWTGDVLGEVDGGRT